jgi:hypothetical protein
LSVDLCHQTFLSARYPLNTALVVKERPAFDNPVGTRPTRDISVGRCQTRRETLAGLHVESPENELLALRPSVHGLDRVLLRAPESESDFTRYGHVMSV